MDQKLRLRLAFWSLVAESGYDAVTVRALIGRASISTSTFYKLYKGIEECFVGIVGTTIRGLAEEIRAGSAPEEDLRTALQRSIGRLMEALAREPEMARAVIVESAAAGSRVHDEMESALGEFEALLTEALAKAPRPTVGSTRLASGLVAGIIRVIRKTTLASRVEELPELAPELADWILSVAHEKVISFRAPRARPAQLRAVFKFRGSGSVSPQEISDGGRRATMAAARLAASAGLSGMTSARIRKDAGLTRREFEQHFHGVDDCLLDAIDAISSMAAREADSMAADATGWERHVYREVTALCALAAGDEELARLVLVEITAPGRTGLLRREQLIDRCVAHLLTEVPVKRRPSEVTLAASVAAIWRIAEIEVTAGRASQLPAIAPVFAYMVIATRRPPASNLVGASVR